MLRSPLLARVAGHLLQRRLRRSAGTGTVAWAVRLPLVTLALCAALLLTRLRTTH
jgi:hypothetical protein